MKLTEDTQKVIDRCNILIKEYAEKGERMTGDQLINMQDKLAVASCYLGDVEAEYNRDYALSYRNRIMVKSSTISMAIAEGESTTKAKECAEEDPEVSKARYDEITNSYLAEMVQNKLKGINRILTAIQYRLTRLRDERRDMINKTM